MLSPSLGISSSSTKWSDVPLSTMILKGDIISAGVKTPFRVVCHQSRERDSFVEVLIKVEGGSIVVVGRRKTRAQYNRGNVSAVVLRRVWYSLGAMARFVVR